MYPLIPWHRVWQTNKVHMVEHIGSLSCVRYPDNNQCRGGFCSFALPGRFVPSVPSRKEARQRKENGYPNTRPSASVPVLPYVRSFQWRPSSRYRLFNGLDRDLALTWEGTLGGTHVLQSYMDAITRACTSWTIEEDTVVHIHSKSRVHL